MIECQRKILAVVIREDRVRIFPALALMAASAFSTEARSQPAFPPCPAPFATLLADQVFDRYAVPVGKAKLAPAAPDVKTGRAHLYREAIRTGAKPGPNFGGHYTIIRIGCGAATTCLAIANATTGHVYFPPELVDAEALLVDTGKLEIDTFNYRLNSRLLIVVGTPNENQGGTGISYFLWQSGKLSLVRFTPAAKLCGLPASTRF